MDVKIGETSVTRGVESSKIHGLRIYKKRHNEKSKMSDESEENEINQPRGESSKQINIDQPKTFEPSPPVTPNAYKLAITPSSPTSNKMSSSNGGSILGTGCTSHTSSRTKLLEPSITPIEGPSGSSKFLYVKEKIRRPSLLSDFGCRTPKDVKSSQRISNLKKDLNLNVFAEHVLPTVPPNTPSPSGWRNESTTELFSNKNFSFKKSTGGSSNAGSDISSQVTTKALVSESENTSTPTPLMGTSIETMLKAEKPIRPMIPLDYGFGSNSALNWSDHYSYMKPSRTGHTGLRSLGSSSFIKSLWSSKSLKNAQHHCFLSDITDVRQMEHALLQLLEDFHSGKLRAFAKDCSMEQMQGIREQQERLTRLHFDLGAQQDLFAPLSEEGLQANQENMQKLMGSLEQLSLSIEKLQLFSKDVTQ